MAARDALIEIGAPAVQPLLTVLRNARDEPTSAPSGGLPQAGRVAGKWGRHPTTPLANKAALTLSMMSHPEIADSLLGMLTDKSPTVRWAGAFAFGRRAPEKRAVVPVIALLKDPSAKTRRQAVRTLGKLADPRAVSPLIAAMKDTDENVRISILSTAAAFKDPRTLDMPRQGLKDASLGVRRAALRYLAYRKDEPAVKMLLGALEDKDVKTRGYAVELLGRMKLRPAVEPLIRIVERGDDLPVIEMAAAALAAINDKRALEPLRRLLKHKNVHCRKAAASALKKMGVSTDGRLPPPSRQITLTTLGKRLQAPAAALKTAVGYVGMSKATGGVTRIMTEEFDGAALRFTFRIGSPRENADGSVTVKILGFEGIRANWSPMHLRPACRELAINPKKGKRLGVKTGDTLTVTGRPTVVVTTPGEPQDGVLVLLKFAYLKGHTTTIVARIGLREYSGTVNGVQVAILQEAAKRKRGADNAGAEGRRLRRSPLWRGGTDRPGGSK